MIERLALDLVFLSTKLTCMNKTINKKQNLIWLDLEMTGLQVETDHILEIALIITDNDLNLLHEGPSLVIHQSDVILEHMDPWCIEQHAKSGLTKAVCASTITVAQAEIQVLDIIKQFCNKNAGVLAGNTVWQDRIFLARYMPTITDYLHYRLIDVSAIKELVNRWYPNDPHVKYQKQNTHRALEDIRESIAELAHYKQYFFK